jgi:hypothetical protein
MITDQGWTTENTAGTYQTSSWFEVSILRPAQQKEFSIITPTIESQVKRLCRSSKNYRSICAAAHAMFPENGLQLRPRTSLEMEPQRLHCDEMINVGDSKEGLSRDIQSQSTKEGEYAWYLQGNEVARGKSIFDDEMVRRYKIIWGSRSNSRWIGNEGTGRGENFVDSLQEGDWIVVWARAKASLSKRCNTTRTPGLISLTEARLGKHHSWHSNYGTVYHLISHHRTQAPTTRDRYMIPQPIRARTNAGSSVAYKSSAGQSRHMGKISKNKRVNSANK